MPHAPQVSKQAFEEALVDLGHDPNNYRGQKLSLNGMSQLYEIDEEAILEAIDLRHVSAHYDYHNDEIWIDALDAAHFYFCVRQEAHLYSA